MNILHIIDIHILFLFLSKLKTWWKIGHCGMFFCVYFWFHPVSNLQQTLYFRVRVGDIPIEGQKGRVCETSETSILSDSVGSWIEK
jgi:hypothetical protein